MRPPPDPQIATLLPTPQARDGTGPHDPDWIAEQRRKGHGVANLNDTAALLPTPAAGAFNDGEDLANWEERRQRLLARHYNGNGMSTPLSVVVRRDVAAGALLPSPAARDNKGVSCRRPHADGYVRAERDNDLPTVVDKLPLFRTPTAQLADNGGAQHPAKRRKGGHGPTLADEVEFDLGAMLLPTPRATRGGSRTETMYALGGEIDPESGEVVLEPCTDAGLLPTPKASEHGQHSSADSHAALSYMAANDLLPTPRAAHGLERNQVPYARPPGDPQNLENALALLPTPGAADGDGGHMARSGDRKDEPLLGGIRNLLPTPGATDAKGGNAVAGGKRKRGSRVRPEGDADLAEVVESMLPTPTARARGGANGRHGDPEHGDDLAEAVQAQQSLLPTPRATDGTKGAPNQRGSSGDLMLPSAVVKDIHMLPTPMAVDALDHPPPNKSAHTTQWDGNNSMALMANAGALPEGEAQLTDWGKYAGAVLRWAQVTGRMPPSPLEPGRSGKGRLSKRFVEWMMGLPDGWVTDVPGISRNAMLKALGNGVVPLQALLALDILAGRIREHDAGIPR